MADPTSLFEHWTTNQLEAYIGENGGAVYPNADRASLIREAARLSVIAEQQVTQSRGLAPYGDSPPPQRSAPPDHGGASAVFYPEIRPATAGASPGPPQPNTYTDRQMHGPPPVTAPRVGGPGQVPAPMPPAGGAKKRAMIVGINYIGSSMALGGCINDARCMEFMLRSRFGFRPENMLLMTDDQRDPSRIPTRYNMMMGMQWLLTGMSPGDSLVFTYSGHGSRQKDYSGEELDGYNETLVPLDSRVAGEIVDDELNNRLINPLPAGVKLHAIIDACHSGSVMDLPYSASIVNGMPQWRQEYQFTRSNKGTAGGFAVQIGASQDSQTAADTNRLSGNVSTGAATYAFIQALERKGAQISYGELLVAMDYAIHHALGAGGGGGLPALPGGALTGMLGGLLLGGLPKGHETQRPQLSSAYSFDMNFMLQL